MELLSIVKDYLKIFPNELSNLSRLLDQLHNNEPLNDRKNFRGHIAGDAVALSSDHKQIVLIHHNIYKMWMQPGGHWDTSDPTPLAAARRELAEETGLQDFSLLEWYRGNHDLPIDIALDEVPANAAKNEPSHFHHTFAYVFEAKDKTLNHKVNEVSGAKWTVIKKAAAANGSHIPNLINKLRHFGII